MPQDQASFRGGSTVVMRPETHLASNSSPSAGIQATAATNHCSSSVGSLTARHTRYGRVPEAALEAQGRRGRRRISRGDGHYGFSSRWRSSASKVGVPVRPGRAPASRRRRPAARPAARTSGACHPRPARPTSPASRSTLRCLETPGWLEVQSVHELARPQSARLRAGDRGSRGARGSARAAKVVITDSYYPIVI